MLSHWHCDPRVTHTCLLVQRGCMAFSENRISLVGVRERSSDHHQSLIRATLCCSQRSQPNTLHLHNINYVAHNRLQSFPRYRNRFLKLSKKDQRFPQLNTSYAFLDIRNTQQSQLHLESRFKMIIIKTHMVIRLLLIKDKLLYAAFSSWDSIITTFSGYLFGT